MGELSKIAQPRYLFGDLNETPFKNLARDRKVALFLDFDGTLVPIRQNPAECFLSEKIKKQLRSLADSEGICLTIMSGRSLSDVRKRVGIRKIYYGGNHGLDISGPGARYTHAKALSAKPLMRHVKHLLKREIAGIEGAWLEDKKYTVSLHFRSVKKNQVPAVKKVFYEAARDVLESKSMGVVRGKKVLELTPDPAWNKGTAVLWILRRLKDRLLPVYVGDDKTDETAFAALSKRGITVRVGKSKSTHAKFYIEGNWDIPLLLESIQKHAAKL
jgi:trehalose-phosphatase